MNRLDLLNNRLTGFRRLVAIARTTWSKRIIRFDLAVLSGLILGSAMGAHAQAVPATTAPAPTRVVVHPDWGGATATKYLAAVQANYQYPPNNLAIDNTYDDLLNAWGDGAQVGDTMDPVPMPPDPTTAPSSPSTAPLGPQYTFTLDRSIVVGTSGDTVTATLTIVQSSTSTAPTTLQVVSASLLGSTAYEGVTVASVPYSCAGAVCTFTWTNPSLDPQFWGPLTIQATVTSNNYPGTWVVYKQFYSSPTMAGKFTGQFSDSIVNGSLVINAGVKIYATQQMPCTVSGNLYSVDNGWPLQHFEQTMLIDPSMTSIAFTFFGKIFTDYGDAGTFSLTDLKAQCVVVGYPAAWYMDPITHASDLQTWATNNPTPPDQPPYIYFGHDTYNYSTATYPNSVFSSAPYQTPAQTAAMVPDLVTFANAEAAGTAEDTAVTDAVTGNTTFVNALGGTTYLLFVHGRRNPATCPDTNDSGTHGEKFGTQTTDQCNLWASKPDTNATKLFVQWNAWDHFFDDKNPNGGNWEVRNALLTRCQHPNRCNIICHSAGCAATEDVLSRLRTEGILQKLNVHNVMAAASAAGGSELANHDYGLPEGVISGHDVAKIDRSLTTNYTRHHSYNHNNMGLPIRAIAGTHLTNPAVEVVAAPPLSWFPELHLKSGDSTNAGCFKVSNLFTDTRLVCVDNVVSLHSSCGHRHAFFYQDCDTTLKGSLDTDFKETYDFHGWWIEDAQDPSGNFYLGPFSSEGITNYDHNVPCNTPDGFCHNYYETHETAPGLADREYQACFNQGHPWICP